MSRGEVMLRKSGMLLEVSTGAAGPPPDDVCRVIEEQLRFNHLRLLYGPDRWDPVSYSSRRAEVVSKLLYRRDSYGRYLCGFGFLKRLVREIRQLGYEICYVDTDLPGECPDRYQTFWDEVRSAFSFRERQEECLQAIAGSYGGVIHAVTGFGKMVIIAMTCMLYLKARIAVVTRRRTLACKLVSFLTRWLPGVGQVGAGHRRYGRVTVYTADSLHHCSYDEDIVLCDEGHELLANKSARSLTHFRHARVFFLTASPRGRMDGADIRMEGLCGPVIFSLTYPEAVKLGLVVPIRVEWSNVTLLNNPCAGMEDVRKERWGVWRNVERNRIIADKARSFRDDDQVLILVRTIEHAVHLGRLLPEFTLVYDSMSAADRASYVRDGLLPGDAPEMTSSLRERLREDFEAGRLAKAIATGIWAVGIDPVRLTALIRADASASEIMDVQAPGRVSRRSDDTDKVCGVVCDFLDQFDAGLASRARKRFRHYGDMGWEQQVIDANGEAHPMPS